MEADKTVAVFQIHLGRVEVEQSLAERCGLGRMEVLHQRSLAGSDKHAITTIAPRVPVFPFLFHGDAGTGGEQRSSQ